MLCMEFLGMYVPLSLAQMQALADGESVTVDVPAEGEGLPTRLTLHSQSALPIEQKCLTGAPHVAHAWGHKDQYKCPGVDVD